MLLVVKGWCFLALVLLLLGLAVLPRTGLRQQGKYRDLSLPLQFRMLPNVLLVLGFHASGFQPNKLD